MSHAVAPRWHAMRTAETRMVEDELRRAGFGQADAYRYNRASIRVRVVDPRFEGLSDEARDGMVEPLLDQLPEETQADIINLYTFAPSEVDPAAPLTRAFMLNAEFEDPSQSLL